MPNIYSSKKNWEGALRSILKQANYNGFLTNEKIINNIPVMI